MKKLYLYALAVCAAVVFVVFGVKQYKTWRQTRMVERAKLALTQSKYREASLFARQAVAFDPDCLPAIRILAALAEEARSTNALFWRQRAVQLDPDHLETRLVLARSALAFRQPKLALDTLEAVPPAIKPSADFFKIRGNVHWSLGQGSEAEKNFTQAARLEPTNQTVLINLNLVRLISTNDSIAQSARNQLADLSRNNTKLSDDILRQLRADAIRRTNAPEAVQFSSMLMSSTNSYLADRLSHISILKQTNHKDLQSTLSDLQSQSATNGAHAALLLSWMFSNSMQQDAEQFLHSLPLSTREQLPVRQMEAELLLARREWTPLGALLESNWGDQEYQREFLAAKLHDATENRAGKRSHWLKALKHASGNMQKLLHLARVADSWNWRDEFDETLQTILSAHPGETWVEKQLAVSLHTQGKTKALQNLLVRTCEREPTNYVAKSNLATLGFLLEPDGKRWHQLAHEAFLGDSDHPFITSTHALSLHLQGRTAEGLSIISRLPAETLQQPSIAIWYGFLLSQSGDKRRAEDFLARGKNLKLLPEEIRLLATSQ